MKCYPFVPEITFYIRTSENGTTIYGFKWIHEDGKTQSNRECELKTDECLLAHLERRIVEAKYEAMYPHTFTDNLRRLRGQGDCSILM